MFTNLDWTIILVYLAFAFIIGILMTRKASKGIQSYFIADRSLPWWWLGISIIATTFAADTPLAITGITANDGVAGNWLWWSWAITYMTVTIVFAARWRKSEVLTDVEFIELRYDKKEASVLRGVKAFYFGVIINCFILGWVTTAMTKIVDPFIDWNQIMGPEAFQSISQLYPAFLLFKGSMNTTFTILIVTTIVIIYSTLGGIRGVIITDLFQFAIAMVTAIIFAWIAVDYVGGLDSMYNQLDTIYGEERAGHLTDFFPSLDNPLIPIQIFLIYILIQWWARYDSDGTGYIAQRINTAKTPADSQKGSLLFTITFIALRSWPWIMVALVALIVFPLDDPNVLNELNQGIQLPVSADGVVDRESGYPVLMKLILPAGLLGLTFTSLIAAYMSTVDTHLNWGSSYIVNDLYKRFINPDASQKALVIVSRITVVTVAIIAIIVSSQMSSIESAWKFFWNMASGLGVAQLMRWLWWRANAWTEISAMISGLALTILSSLAFPEFDATYLLAFIATLSFVVAYVATIMTDPVNEEQLNAFIEKTQPVGFWNGMTDQIANARSFAETIWMWVLGLAASYSALFSVGYFLKLNWTMGAALLLLFVATMRSLLLLMKDDE